MTNVPTDAIGKQEFTAARAYKRSPGLSNSTWYKGILSSQMAGTTDNNGAFDLLISKMRRGTEPPPHVHSREDEFFYLFSGEMNVYVDGEVFQVTAGECMFLPRLKPHAFRITSEEIQNIALIVPGGFLDVVNKMNAPADRMDVPSDSDVATYANIDLTETIKLFEQHGIRFLTADEIRTEMPKISNLVGLINCLSSCWSRRQASFGNDSHANGPSGSVWSSLVGWLVDGLCGLRDRALRGTCFRA